MWSPESRSHLLLALASLACLLLQLGDGLRWLASTWADPTYGSAGLLPLLLLAPALLRLPPPRRDPSTRHLACLVAVAAADLALLQPLQINVLRAAAAVICLHLWLVAFRDYRGRWYRHPQLWLGLACLPVVHWANTLVGYPLQRLAAQIAGGALEIYGVPVVAEGTQLRVGELLIGVDSSCSGLKLLYCGALFGVLATAGAGRRLPLPRALLFWLTLASLLFFANVLRVIGLTAAHLHSGQAPGEALHQGVGLAAFVVIAALPSLLLLRRLCLPPPHRITAPPLRSDEVRDGGPSRRPLVALLALAGIAAVSCATPRRLLHPGPAPGPGLPAALAGSPGRALALGPSERLLARSPRVKLERRAYGTTQVALLRVRQGIKELHPPSVCLKAAGFEIVSRRRITIAGGGCLTAIKVRDKQKRLFHFIEGYLAGRTTPRS